MKILYLGTTETTEFMSDSVFHGLRSLLGEDVIDGIKIPHMYTDFARPFDTYHGRGLVTTKHFIDAGIDRTDIEGKIKSRYFDLVIYGAAYRTVYFSALVAEHYPANRVIVINGADHPNVQPFPSQLNGIKFLRETTDADSVSDTYPISFAMPKSLMSPSVTQKEQYLMPLIPGVGETYVYNTTEDYLSEYRISLFGLTWKKAGWDCMRHYEILSQGCIPLFLDIHKLPENVCRTLPVALLKSVLHKNWFSLPGYSVDGPFIYDDRNTLQGVHFGELDFSKLTDEHLDVANMLLHWSHQHLSTETQAKYLLDTWKLYV